VGSFSRFSNFGSSVCLAFKKAPPELRLKWGTEKIRWLPLSQVGQLGAESLSAIALEGKRMSILLTFEILATLLAVSHQ
jgi:hypothetical protein